MEQQEQAVQWGKGKVGKRTMKDWKKWSGKERDVKRCSKEAQEADKDAGKVSGSETKRLKNEMEQVY
jgi:hypothetical protein